MAISDLPIVGRIWQDHGSKLLRYFGVSAFNVIVGNGTLAFCFGVLNWSGIASNITAVLVTTPIAYLLSRYWVWQQKRGEHRMNELLPFWTMAAIGLIVSTIAVGWVDTRTDKTIWIVVANLSAFGVIWVVKYVYFDKVMWKDQPGVEAAESLSR